MHGSYGRAQLDRLYSKPDNYIGRADWLKRYEASLIAARPELAGKVDFHTANGLFDKGFTSDNAARVASVLPTNHAGV